VLIVHVNIFNDAVQRQQQLDRTQQTFDAAASVAKFPVLGNDSGKRSMLLPALPNRFGYSGYSVTVLQRLQRYSGYSVTALQRYSMFLSPI